MPRLKLSHSRVLPALVAAALLCVAAPARAGYADYDITRARLAMQRADYLLSDAEWAADVARDDLQRADQRAKDLSGEVAKQEREVDDASRRLDDADRAAKWLREDVDRLLEKVDERKKELDAADERLRAAREALDKLTGEAVASFEAGEAYRAAAAAVEEAGRALEAAEKSSLDVLALTVEHRAAVTTAEALQARVQFLADQGDRAAAELAEAQQELADARKRLRDTEDRHLSQDQKVADAERRVAQARDAVQSLRDDFDEQLAQKPEVAEARKAASAGQENYDAALRALRQTETQVVDAQEELRRHEEVVRLESDRLDNANNHLNKLLDELREADTFAAASDRRLRDALEAVECARRERDAAAWSLARAEEADAFYRWDAPYYGHGWTVVHVGRVDCDPRPHRPVYFHDDPDCHRPSWCRPLTSFHHAGWASRHGGSRHDWAGWEDDNCRPVVVRVVKYRRPVVIREIVRHDSRQKAIVLAGRTASDEQRVQRQAAVERQRKQVVERRERLNETKLVGGPTQGGQLALAQFPLAGARLNERVERQQADARRAERVAAIRDERERRSNGRDPALERAAARGDFAAAEKLRGQQLRQANIEARSTQGPVANVVPGSDEAKRLRWAERRAQDQREREQREMVRLQRRAAEEQAAALKRQQKEQQAKQQQVKEQPRQQQSAPPQAQPQQSKKGWAVAEPAPREQRVDQRADKPDKVERREDRREARNDAQDALRQQRAAQESAERAAREQRQQQQANWKTERDASEKQAAEARRVAAQAERQRDAEIRQQRQAAEAARDATRQREVAEQRAQRQSAEQARAAQREAARESQRQAEQQRSAERAAQREAQRVERQAPRVERAERVERSEPRQSDSGRRNNDGDRGGRRR